MATIRAFEPKFMKVGILSAALQELTPRDVRDVDPDRAIEDWIAYARELGADELQLSAALHPNDADVPPEAMLDPVANTLDLRKPFDGQRATRVQAALKSAGIALSDLAYFDNLLHHDVGQEEEARLPPACVRGRPGAWRPRGLRLRRPEQRADARAEPRRVRIGVRAAAQRREGARAGLSRRAMSDAGMDDRRRLAQQHRVHARRVDRVAPHL